MPYTFTKFDAELISTALSEAATPFDTVRCGIAGHTQSRMQSATQRLALGPIPVVIRVYEATGKVIETLEHTGEFKEP
jgi:hypothetical protein